MAQHHSPAAKVLVLNMPGSHMGASSNPGNSASHPTSCLCLRGRSKVLGPCTCVGDLEEALGFRLAQLQPLQPLGE